MRIIQSVKRFFSSIGSFVSNLLAFPSSIYHGVVDGIDFARHGTNFLLGNLVDKALQSRKGYSVASLFGAYRFMMVTDKNLVKHASNFGEYDEHHPQDFDPKYRDIFHFFIDLIGADGYVNWHGGVANVTKERSTLKSKLMPSPDSPHNLIKVSMEAFEQVAERWSADIPVGEQIGRACIDILGEVFYGLPRNTIPANCYHLLKEADDCIASANPLLPNWVTKSIPLWIRNNRLFRVSSALKKMNDDYLKEHADAIINGDNYMSYLLKGQERYKGKRTLEEWNPIASLIAASNFGTILSSLICKLAEEPGLQDRLREELSSFKWQGANKEELFDQLNSLKLLDGVFKEGLRYFAPAPAVVHYASKAGHIGDVPVSPRTFILVPLRRLLHDPVLWREPEKFNPYREFPQLGTYPFMPMSTGDRACAAQHIFVHKVVKIGLAVLISKYNFTLKGDRVLETIPVESNFPRFKKPYYCSTMPVDESKASILTAYKQVQSTQRSSPSVSVVPTVMYEEKSNNSQRVGY